MSKSGQEKEKKEDKEKNTEDKEKEDQEKKKEDKTINFFFILKYYYLKTI